MNAFVPLTETGLLAVKGVDAKKFLQGQLTCQLDEITSTQSSFAARCNLQGRVRAFFRLSLFVTQNESFYLIHLPLSMIASLTKDLKQYAMFSQVEIEDLSSRYTTLGLYGDKTPEALNTVFGQAFTLNPHESVMVNWENEYLQICRLLGETPRFEVVGPKAAIEALQTKIPEHFAEHPPQLWQQLDIEAKIPTIYPETADEFLPHHLNLVELGAINFKKGCYLGQEIIARMHYKGKIKKGLYRFSCPYNKNIPKIGGALYTATAVENVAGNIVALCQNKEKYEILAILNHDAVGENVLLSPQDAQVIFLKN